MKQFKPAQCLLALSLAALLAAPAMAGNDRDHDRDRDHGTCGKKEPCKVPTPGSLLLVLTAGVAMAVVRRTNQRAALISHTRM